jgi:nitrate reductase NapD
MSTEEIHIAGAIVHVAPGRLPQARSAIGEMPDVEVRAADDRGKLVVVVEAQSGSAVLDRLDAIRRIEGVLSALLVYQHAESAQSMDEEVIDDVVAT